MVAIITGASSGIGFSTAGLLAKNGYEVYGISRSKSGADFMEEFQADVTDSTALHTAVKAVFAKSGKINLLVVCAGIGLSTPAEATNIKDARDLLDVNFFAAAEAVRFCLPYMKEANEGKIILISSMSGLFPMPYECFYAASKAALCAYACSVHNEAKPFGISVSVILPGGVRTGFTAKRKLYETLYDNPAYPGYRSSVESLSREEQTGLYASQVARAILRTVKRKKAPALKAVGGIYGFYILLLRLLPHKIILYILRKKYMR